MPFNSNMNPAPRRENKSLGQVIGQYNSYGAKLRSELSMRELAEDMLEIAEYAEQAVMSEADDWYDGHTIKRNMKEIRNYVKEFSKVANEYDAMRQRATALYDDVGRVLERYFEIKEDAANDDEIGYDLDGDGTTDIKAGNAGKGPTAPEHRARQYTENEEDTEDYSDVGVDYSKANIEQPNRAKDLTERLVTLARHRLTGEQLARFDTLRKEIQIKAAWRIVR